AYSGEVDRQKQAADMMARALAAEGIELTHIIGPKTAHAYERSAKAEVSRRIDSIAEKGRNALPRAVKFTTWTLRYDQMLWAAVGKADDVSLHKRHGLQGPIDDAFMDSFLMVKPTGRPMNESVGAWADAEMKHAIDHWRRQFRGDARVKNDADITDDDIASNNLVLWGDPRSNKLLAKIADQLPIRW